MAKEKLDTLFGQGHVHRSNVTLGFIAGAVISAVWTVAEFGAEDATLAGCLWLFVFLPLFGLAGAILAAKDLRMLACGSSIAAVILLANHRWS